MFIQKRHARGGRDLHRRATRQPQKYKDPRGYDEFVRMFAEHSALGQSLTMTSVQSKRPTLWDLESDLKFSVPLLSSAATRTRPASTAAFFSSARRRRRGCWSFRAPDTPSPAKSRTRSMRRWRICSPPRIGRWLAQMPPQAMSDPAPDQPAANGGAAEISATAVASSCAPFRHPAFIVIWTATLVANVGGWMYSAASGWLMTDLDPSPLIVSLVQAATTAPLFLFALPAGALADIFDKRRFLIVFETLATIVAAIYAALVTLSSRRRSTFFCSPSSSMRRPR